MVSRGDRTREQLLDAAEHLMGANGVGHVSMRQIRLAAGQGNEQAVQYHFGDLTGVIAALAARHTPRVEEIQAQIVATNGENPTLRQVADAMTRPIAEYCTRGASERAWVRILADLISDPTLSFTTIQDGSPPLAASIGMSLYERLSETVPQQTAGERVWAVAQFVIHASADRARLRDDPNAGRELSADDAFVDNLVAMAYGALTAPLP